MKKQLSIVLAAGILMAGVPAAMAAGPQSSGSANTLHSMSAMLSLTKAQRTRAWNDLQRQATEQNKPSSFKPAVGSVVPSTIKIEQLALYHRAPVPNKAASDVPSLRAYDFLIVIPSDKKVAAIVAETVPLPAPTRGSARAMMQARSVRS